MKKRNRWLSMLLTVTMITAQLPAPSVMAAADEDEAYEMSIEEEPDAVSSSDTEEVTAPEADMTSVSGETEEAPAGEAAEAGTEDAAEEVLAENGAAAEEAVPEEENIDGPADAPYVEDRVYALAGSEAEAETIAAAYNAKLESFADSIAYIDLTDSGYTVETALKAYADSNGTLPEVNADHIAEISDDIFDMAGEQTMYALGRQDYLTAGGGWRDFYSGLQNPDPGVNPSSADYQWYHDMMETYTALNASRGSKDVATAIISDGVKYGHEELEGKKASTPAKVKNGADIYDRATPLAGIIAATLDNGKGGTGIAPNTTIFSFSAVDAKGQMSEASIEAGISHIARMTYQKNKWVADGDLPRAQVILIDAKFHTKNSKLEAVINAAVKLRNITFIAPAGDEDSEVEVYPAAFEKVIGVAAVDANGEKTARSNYGDWVTLAAPGYEIYAPSGSGNVSANLSKYTYMSGTSAAAAMVAGACAFYMSVEGTVSPTGMKDILLNKATEVQPVKVISTVTLSGNASQKERVVYPGKGIVNVGRIIGGDEIAPAIKIYEFEQSTLPVLTSKPGEKTPDEVTSVPMTANIRLEAMRRETVNKKKVYQPLKEVNVKYICTYKYSTERINVGDVPDPGVMKYSGMDDLYTGENTYPVYDGVISLNEVIPEDAYGIQHVVLKARCIDTKGNLGNVVTIKFATVHIGKNPVSVNILNAPQTFMAGKKLKMRAEVYYLDEYGEYKLHENQNVRWAVAGYSAYIDEKGYFRANKGADGEVTIICTPEVDSSVKEYADVLVSSTVSPIKSITLTGQKGELDFYDPMPHEALAPDEGNKLPQKECINFLEVSVNAAYDKLGMNRYADGTINFEWKTNKPKVAEIELLPGRNSVRIIPKGKGTARISCVALDGSNKTVKYEVTVKQLTDKIKIKGQANVVFGKKAKFKATCNSWDHIKLKYVKPNNKKVTWTLLDTTSENNLLSSSIATIDSKGVLIPGAVDKDTKVWVVATSQDRGHFSYYKEVTILASGTGRAKSVKIVINKDHLDAEKITEDYYAPVKKPNGDLKSIKMHSLYATRYATAATEVVLEGIVNTGVTPEWSSSNPEVINPEEFNVYNISDNKITMRARKTGTTTITCNAGDGSGRKAKLTITVVVPASSVMIVDKKLDVIHKDPEHVSYSYLAQGGSTTLKASFGSVYGTPSVKTVKWKSEIVGYDYVSGNAVVKKLENDYPATAMMKAKVFTMNNGVVGVNAKYFSLFKSYDHYLPSGCDGYALLVTANTTDGSMVSAQRLIIPVHPLSNFRIYEKDSSKSIEKVDTIKGRNDSLKINFEQETGEAVPGFTATSSDTSILKAYVSEDGKTLHYTSTKTGTVVVEVRPNDGSGKVARVQITVK